jgi:rhodanese-related sulfurtransferase
VAEIVDRHGMLRLRDARGAQIVDVLPPEEFRALHVPGAVSLPLKNLDPDLLSELDRERPVIVYCSGHT